MTSTVPQVYLNRCLGYGSDELHGQLDELARMLAVPVHFGGDLILLKPNLISSRAPALACTNARFLEAITEWFVNRGGRVALGDSPAFGSLRQVLVKHSMIDFIKRFNVTIVDFKTPRPVELSNGVRLEVADELFGFSYVVNVPKLKAHNQLFVTGAVKNLFGAVVGLRKPLAHMKYGASHCQFAQMLIDLANVLPIDLNVVDGIEVMHRSGPVNGELLKLNCLAASRDALALDAALITLLGVAPERCPVVHTAQLSSSNSHAPGVSHFPMLPPDAFLPSGFVGPEVLSPVPFNPLRFVASSLRRAYLALHRRRAMRKTGGA